MGKSSRFSTFPCPKAKIVAKSLDFSIIEASIVVRVEKSTAFSTLSTIIFTVVFLICCQSGVYINKNAPTCGLAPSGHFSPLKTKKFSLLADKKKYFSFKCKCFVNDFRLFNGLIRRHLAAAREARRLSTARWRLMSPNLYFIR